MSGDMTLPSLLSTSESVPSFLFLCQPFVILLHLFCAQSTILSSYASISTCRRNGRISSFCKVHVSLPYKFIQQHSRQILSPYVFTDEGCMRSLFLLKAFSQCNSPSHFMTTSTVFTLQSPDFRGNKIVLLFQVLSINFDSYRSSFHL